MASIAHVEAVAVALDFLERRAGATRQQVNGQRERIPTGLAAATFVHRTSREGDPQLHTHCVVANLGRRTDGSYAALDGHPLYEWGRAAGSVYQEELRRRLTLRLGVEWGADRRAVMAVPASGSQCGDGQLVTVVAATATDGGAARVCPPARRYADRRSSPSSSSRPPPSPRTTVVTWRPRPLRLVGRWVRHAVPRIRSATLAARPLRHHAHQDGAVFTHMLCQPRLPNS